MNPVISQRVNILRLNIPRPSALPFHILTWGQRFVMHHNCRLSKNGTALHQAGHNAFDSNCNLYGQPKNLKNIAAESKFVVRENHTLHFPTRTEINYVYYTESDELVHFQDLDTLRAISLASNRTCLFLGRRAERAFPKVYNPANPQPPEDYNHYYMPGRYCGQNGFQLSYQDNFVRTVPKPSPPTSSTRRALLRGNDE